MRRNVPIFVAYLKFPRSAARYILLLLWLIKIII